MRTLLADRRIRLFYLASAASAVGDDALYLALAVWVKELTGSTSLAGLDICAVAAGALFAPLTGVIVDRVRRLPLLTGVYLTSAALVMTLLAVSGRGQVWLIIVVTFLYGVSGTVSDGALGALVQKIVPAGRLAEANGIEQTLLQGMKLVTPALGIGLLAWLGGHAVAVLDAGTFLIAVALLTRIRVDEQPGGRGGRGHCARERWARDLATGFGYVARSAVIRQVTIAYSVAFLVFGVSVPLVLEVVTAGLHHPASWLAILSTAEGTGGAVGGLTAGWAASRTGDRMLTASALAALALLIAAFAVPADAVVVAAMAGFGLFIAWFFVGGSTICQKHTPNELMGRVSGARSLAVQAAQASGNALGAALVLLLPYRDLCYLAGAALAATALYLGATDTRRTDVPDRRDDQPGRYCRGRPYQEDAAAAGPARRAPARASTQVRDAGAG